MQKLTVCKDCSPLREVLHLGLRHLYTVRDKKILSLGKFKQTLIIMNTGTVKFFNESKGFGFIKDDASQKEYFVHVSGLQADIRENDKVTFDLQEGKKGLNAVNVKLA